MANPVEPLTDEEKQNALRAYLGHYLGADPSLGERRSALEKIVAAGDFAALRALLRCDQHYEEPLYHIANGGTL